MSSREQVYCVAVAFKMTEQVKQWLWIKFYIKLEYSSMETIWMIQNAMAMVIGSFIPTTHPFMDHISSKIYWLNVKSPRWLRTPAAHIWHPVTSGFSPNLNLWKRRDFRLLMRFRKIWLGGWWQLGELCKISYFEGVWGLIVLCTMFLVSCIFFKKCLYFAYYMAGCLLDITLYVIQGDNYNFLEFWLLPPKLKLIF